MMVVLLLLLEELRGPRTKKVRHYYHRGGFPPQSEEIIGPSSLRTLGRSVMRFCLVRVVQRRALRKK